MVYLAQSQYLLLLLIVPLLFVAYALYLRARRKRLARFGSPELVSQLMPDASTGKGWLKISLLAAAWFFFVIGLARPQLGARLKEHQSQGVEVMVALDVSNSMLAEDYSPNRLERSKLAISRLVDKLQGDRIGLVVFAGEAFVQLPITADYVSAKVFLKSIDTESVPIQGTALSEALMASARSFSTQSERSRAIILITDGEDHEGEAIEAARAIAEQGIRIYCIGVGSPQGKPIPKNGSLLKDASGEIVAGAAEFGLNPIIDDIRTLDKEQFNSVVFEDFDEQFMYFFAIALFFLILELLVSDTKARRHLFKR